jgi:homoprotocatechuate degradation regulator HpaR
VRKSEGSSQQKERALAVRLLQVREGIMTLARPVLRRHGFSEQQWRVLRRLSREAPMDKTNLARQAVLLPPSLTRILRDLGALGLVRAVPEAANHRLVRIALTAKGEKAAARCSADLLAMNKMLRQKTGDDAFEGLLDALERFEERLEKT